MKMSEYLKRRRILLAFTILLIVVVLFVSIITLVKNRANRNQVQEQDLKVTYNLNKTNNVPRDKEQGLTNTPLSTVIIKNNKSYKQEYKLVIKPKENSTLEFNKVYININNETKILSDYNDGEVYTGTINSNEEKTISFKIWIGSDLISSEDEDKVLNLKYEVIKK